MEVLLVHDVLHSLLRLDSIAQKIKTMYIKASCICPILLSVLMEMEVDFYFILEEMLI